MKELTQEPKNIGELALTIINTCLAHTINDSPLLNLVENLLEQYSERQQNKTADAWFNKWEKSEQDYCLQHKI